MLLNDFYYIDQWQHTENSFSGKVSFNPTHAIFKGHFPNNPVVPGVCMMVIFTELLAKHFSVRLFITEASVIKFLQLIPPNIQPMLHATFSITGEQTIHLTASLKNNDAFLFKMTGIFKTIS